MPRFNRLRAGTWVVVVGNNALYVPIMSSLSIKPFLLSTVISVTHARVFDIYPSLWSDGLITDFIFVRRLRLLGVYPGLLWDRALRSYRTAPQGRGGVSPGGQSEGLQCPARWGNKNTKLDEAPSNLALTPQSFCTDLSTPLAHRAENFTRPLLPGALLRNRVHVWGAQTPTPCGHRQMTDRLINGPRGTQ